MHRDSYTIKAVTTVEEFNALKPIWDQLAKKEPSHFPFLCFDWYKCWLNHFLGDKRLLILVLYNGESVSAIAPFLLFYKLYGGILKSKTISLVGNIHSPIKNFIYSDSLNETERQSITNHFLQFLCKEFKDWDVIEFDSIPEEDGCFQRIQNAVKQASFRCTKFFCYNDWVLDDINFSGDTYFKNRSKNLRKELGKRRRRLERQGNLVIDIDEGKNIDNLDYYLNIYNSVRDKSWKHPEKDFYFLREFRKFAREKGWLRFSVLFFDAEPISCHIRLTYQDVCYFLESVYNQEYSKYSPTTILRSELFKHVIDQEHVSIVHTIRGDEQYKQGWTPKKNERLGLKVFNQNFNGKLLGFLAINLLPFIEKHPKLSIYKNKFAKYLSK